MSSAEHATPVRAFYVRASLIWAFLVRVSLVSSRNRSCGVDRIEPMSRRDRTKAGVTQVGVSR